MSMPIVTRVWVVVLLTHAMPVSAQHEGHMMPGSPAGAELLTACVQSQQQVMALVDAGARRLELARQTNDPTAMRATVDDVQRTLSAVRTQLASCTQLAAATPTPDPHAGHAMPLTQVTPPAATPTLAAGTAGASSSTSSQSGTPPHDHEGPAQGAPAQATRATSASNLDIALLTRPNPPRGAAGNDFEVTVKDRQGKPVDGADVSLLFYMAAMPSMKMPEMRSEAKLKAAGSGKYAGTAQVVMAGPWTVTVSVKQNGKEIGQKKVELTAK